MPYRNTFGLLLILWTAACFSQEQFKIGQSHSINSKILNERRTFQTYLPASYHWALDRRYPVLYVLDGESNFLHTAGSVSFLSAQGEIPELIVIGITSTVRIRDFTQTDWSSHWIGGGGAKDFKKFLSEELFPEIEQNYRTNGFRILAGHSASGQFVLYALASEPSLCNAFVAISPSLDWDDNLPQRSLEESFEHTDSLKAFLYFAWSDDLGQALADDQRIVEILETKSPKGFRWAAKGFPEETHLSIPLLAHIDALRQLYNGYRLHDDLLDRGLVFAEEHFKRVSEKVGYSIPVPEDIINNFGYEQLERGNIQEAIKFFKHNINQNPNSANAFDSLAEGYEKAGLWNEAIRSSEKAVDLAKKYNSANLDSFMAHAKKIKSSAATNSKAK